MSLRDKLFSKHQSFQYSGENPPLVRALHEMAFRNSNENRKKMYSALLNSTILVPTPELPIISQAVGEPDGNTGLQLTFITNKYGHKLTPAFTDIEALRCWDPNTPCLSARAVGFVETISHSFSDIQGIIINPFDPIRKMIRPTAIIMRWEFADLGCKLPPTVETCTLASRQVPNFSLEEAIQPPSQTASPALLEALSKSARSIPEIASLHLFSLSDAHGPPQLTVGVGLDRTVAKEHEQFILRTLWAALAPGLTDCKSLEFVVTIGRVAEKAACLGVNVYQRTEAPIPTEKP